MDPLTVRSLTFLLLIFKPGSQPIEPLVRPARPGGAGGSTAAHHPPSTVSCQLARTLQAGVAAVGGSWLCVEVWV